jgi:hypothetical protein
MDARLWHLSGNGSRHQQQDAGRDDGFMQHGATTPAAWRYSPRQCAAGRGAAPLI